MAAAAQSETVGLIATWLNSDYWLRIVAGATEVLKREGITPVCFTLGTSARCDLQAPSRFFDLVNQQCLSGVMVISAASFQSEAESFLRRLNGLPAVCVGRSVQGVPSLWVQNGLGIRMVMKHLTETCGRRRLAFIRGPVMNKEAEARYRAWEDFCIEHSLPHDEKMVEQGEFTEATGEAAALRILEKNPGELPDALVVSNDRMALGALIAARKRGLRVPDDISIVGFDDLEAERANPPLTTIRQPVFEMGYRAAETMVALLRKGPVTESQMFTPELIVRASCLPRQSKAKCNSEETGYGARAFLDSAYPSPDTWIPAIRTSTHVDGQGTPTPSGGTGPQLNACELEKSLRAHKAREELLINAVRDLRLYAISRIEQALSQANSVRELHSIMMGHLQLLSLSSLTAAMVHDESGFQGEARLILDCTTGNRPAIGQPNAWLPCAQIVAAHGQRNGGALRIVQPLNNETEACGFLLASGSLSDSAMINRIGIALARAALRIGTG
ncbi:MAG TPA: substrate-binding domain-containing protein [Polyangiaceae bacterium]|nr:substrate-binding domain-containing protein [Polyangiaceae bacterium]